MYPFVIESKCQVTATGLEPRTTQFVNEHSTIWPVAVTSTSDFAPALSKEFLDIQATVECGFTLKRVLDMTRTYCQMSRFGISTKLHIRFKLKIKKIKIDKTSYKSHAKDTKHQNCISKKNITGLTVRRHKHADNNTPTKKHCTKAPTSKEHLKKVHTTKECTIFITHDVIFF